MTLRRNIFINKIFKEAISLVEFFWYQEINQVKKFMNTEIFFIIVAHLSIFLTFLLVYPILSSSKNNKYKTYKR